MQIRFHEFTTKEIVRIKVQDSASSCIHNVNYNHDTYDQHNQPRRSTRQKFSYQ